MLRPRAVDKGHVPRREHANALPTTLAVNALITVSALRLVRAMACVPTRARANVCLTTLVATAPSIVILPQPAPAMVLATLCQDNVLVSLGTMGLGALSSVRHHLPVLGMVSAHQQAPANVTRTTLGQIVALIALPVRHAMEVEPVTLLGTVCASCISSLRTVKRSAIQQ